MPLLDHFGWLAPRYDRMAGPPDVRVWMRRLGLPAAGFLLDAGGGTGRVSDALRPYVSAAVVADVSFRMMEQARAKDGLGAVQSEAETLPFPTGCFARVIMVDAFHHVRDQAAVARELVRVLQPGGRLVIQEPDLRRFAVKIVSVGEKAMLMRSRILYPQALVDLFDGLPVRVQWEASDFNVWIMVDRTG